MFYRIIMKIAHKYNWHYAPPVYPNGDTMFWCKWCGMRDVMVRLGHGCDNTIENCSETCPVEKLQHEDCLLHEHINTKI